jgi:preprotein translocase subunit SecE
LEKDGVAKNQDATKVTRITASNDGGKSTKTAKAKPVNRKPAAKAPGTKRSYGILGRIGGYFKGAWSELRQVHWPTRRATWGLTGAVLLFSAFFVVFITLLDAGFKFVFEQILR